MARHDRVYDYAFYIFTINHSILAKQIFWLKKNMHHPSRAKNNRGKVRVHVIQLTVVDEDSKRDDVHSYIIFKLLTQKIV